jgi:predicted metal-dependent hydrolase
VRSSRQLGREIDKALGQRTKIKKLRALIQHLLTKWKPRLGVHVQTWQIKDAKTYWATTEDHEIWFAADLSNMPPAFVEVILVHELVHQLTNGHDPAFFELMNLHLPGWQRIHARYDKVPALYSNAVIKHVLSKKLEE